jgi:hypothetical protein
MGQRDSLHLITKKRSLGPDRLSTRRYSWIHVLTSFCRGLRTALTEAQCFILPVQPAQGFTADHMLLLPIKPECSRTCAFAHTLNTSANIDSA